MEPFATELLWIVIVSFIISFVLAFAIGANDVANSVSTSVGSGVLSLRKAFMLATCCELLGAVLVGNKVSDTMRKVMLDVSIYENAEKELMLGCLAALCSSACWLLLATYVRLPISCSHSVVGGIIGFSLMGRGTKGLNWFVLINIVISWFASPFISGLISLLLFVGVYHFIVLSKHPKRAAQRSLPIFYFLTFFINVLGIMLDGPKLLYMDLVPLWAVFVASFVAGLLAALIAQFYFVPLQNHRIAEHIEAKSADASSGTEVNVDEMEEVTISFSFLQILSAGFGCFAHGANDVSNAIGPLVAIYAIYADGSVLQKGETPLYLLAYGGVGIILGLWTWGHRVIKTIGTDLSEITTVSGFTIESGSAVTVLTASKIGLPISTTHCKVGAVVFVGHMYGIYEKRRRSTLSVDTTLPVIPTNTKEVSINYISRQKKKRLGVNWGLFRNIVCAWLVTVPVTIALGALFMLILSTAAL